MKYISLVCTVHEEEGLANIPKLCEILERIRPEVIFLECPPNALDQYLNGCTTNKLESVSVRQYRASNSVELVAVDLPTPDDRFFSDYRYLQERIAGKISESQRLVAWNKNYVRDRGFAYLNSEQCSKMRSEINADARAVVGSFKDQRLTEILELCNRTDDLRENEMMENILKYCGENSFEKGAFLIGAAHRHSIIDKSKRVSGEYPNHIQWDFSCGASRTNQKQ
jgi:hypothetical protein